MRGGWSTVEGVLEVGKWGCMGLYLGCESLGIVSLFSFVVLGFRSLQ